MHTQAHTHTGENQTWLLQNKPHILAWVLLLALLLPFKAIQSSSRHSELYGTRRFVTEGTFVTVSPLQNSLFMPQHNVSG